MGPTPSADLVGSILGVEGEDNDFKQQRSTLRKAVTSRNALHSKPQEDSSAKEPPMQIVWRNVLIFIYLHAAALYGGYLCFTAAKSSTLAWCELKSHHNYCVCTLLSSSHLSLSTVFIIYAYCLMQRSSCFCLADLELRAGRIDCGLIVVIRQSYRFVSLLPLHKRLLFR